MTASFVNRVQNRNRFQNLYRKFIKKVGDRGLLYLSSSTFSLQIFHWMEDGYNNECILQLMIREYYDIENRNFDKRKDG